MILSLQGCMAVGKTTATRFLLEIAPYIRVSYEENAEVVREIRKRRLQKNLFEDYVEIQRLWIRNEILRWEKTREYPCSVMDFGAEEIEFHTLHYPRTIGENWPVEDALKEELTALRRCMPDRILFMDASEETLRAHKDGDAARVRSSFEEHLTRFLPLKRAWFIGRENVDVLRVDGMSREEVGERVKAWCDDCMGRGAVSSAPKPSMFRDQAL